MEVTAEYDSTLYPKEALLKAAFAFVEDYYIHLEIDRLNYQVRISSKEEKDLPNHIQKDFENELLVQTVRFHVLKETSDLRKLILARAMASTVLLDEKDEKAYFDVDSQKEYKQALDGILEDWFSNGKSS